MANILFKVAGGYTFGMGHIFRSLTLAQCFLKRGQTVMGFLCNKDKICIAEIQKRGYKVIESELEGMPPSDLPGGLPDAVIIDTPINQPRFIKETRARWSKAYMVGLDYVDFMEAKLDLIINLHNHNTWQSRPTNQRILYLEGPLYAILRPEFDAYTAKARRPLSDRIERITICMGGSDMSGATAIIIDALSSFTDWQGVVDVVIGPAFNNNKLLLTETRNMPWTFRFHESPINLAELMSRADVAFSGGGTTMLEFLALGIPTVVLSRTEQEDRYSEIFANTGCILRVSQKNVSKESVCRTLNRLAANPILRREMHERSIDMIDGKGRERIIAVILNHLNET